MSATPHLLSFTSHRFSRSRTFSICYRRASVFALSRIRIVMAAIPAQNADLFAYQHIDFRSGRRTTASIENNLLDDVDYEGNKSVSLQFTGDEDVLLDRLSFDEVSLNDGLDDIRGTLAIPCAFRVNQHDGALLADAKAIHLRE